MDEDYNDEKADNKSLGSTKPEEGSGTKRRVRRKGGGGGGRRLRDKNAPPRPKTGYLLYMTERRPEVTRQIPKAPVYDVNRQIAQEWNTLDEQSKQQYLKQAAVEKQKYKASFEEYKKTESYKIFRKKLQAAKRSRREYEDDTEDGFSYNLKSGDVPIFTNEFLEHCRERDVELRKLRKSVVELEEEEDALEHRISRLRTAIRDTETHSLSHTDINNKLRARLDSTHKALVEAFAKIPLPNGRKGPSMDTIEAYVETVEKLSLEAPEQNQHFLAQIRHAAAKIKLPN